MPSKCGPPPSGTLERLPQPDKGRIARKIDALATNPRPVGSKKLTNDDYYRVRVGDYRILYVINDDAHMVIVAVIGHRRDVYR